MSITTMTSRAFNQETGNAKKAARDGPVYVTDRGQVSFVLLKFADYERLTQKRTDILDLLTGPPGVGDIDLDIRPPRDLTRPADFD